MLIHTAGAWESDDGTTLYIETSRVHDNAFPFFPTDNGRGPDPNARADFVRFTLDLTQPTGEKLRSEPEIILDLPSEFPRVDERFLTRPYDVLFLNALTPKEHINGSEIIFHGLDGLAMHRHSTNETRYFYSGPDSVVEEPAFIPRSVNAPEGDGWVMCMVERKAENRNDLIIIDTDRFETPIAIVQLPFHVKAQVHGNWIDQSRLKERTSLVRSGETFEISRRGALEIE